MRLRVERVDGKWRVVGSATGEVQRVRDGPRAGQPLDGGGYRTRALAREQLRAIQLRLLAEAHRSEDLEGEGPGEDDRAPPTDARDRSASGAGSPAEVGPPSGRGPRPVELQRWEDDGGSHCVRGAGRAPIRD